MQIATIPALLTALNEEASAFTVTDVAAQLLSRILILHTKTYSPFAQMSAAVGGLIGNLLHRDFADKNGEQTGTLVQLSPTLQQQFGLTAEQAGFLVHQAQKLYTITPIGPRYTFTKNTSTSQPKQKVPDKYAKYL